MEEDRPPLSDQVYCHISSAKTTAAKVPCRRSTFMYIGLDATALAE